MRMSQSGFRNMGVNASSEFAMGAIRPDSQAINHRYGTDDLASNSSPSKNGESQGPAGESLAERELRLKAYRDKLTA